MTLTDQQLSAILPALKPVVLAIYGPFLRSVLPDFRIDTPQRLGGFIAQVAYECINFTTMAEIDSGSRYEGRADLGNNQPGDGPRFKGRGAIQVTGRGNYAWCSRTLFGDDRLIKNPDLLLQPENAIKSACWFWTVAKPTLNSVCDQPETYVHQWHGNDYTKIGWMTLLVNGGQNGLAGRTANYMRAKTVLGF